MNSTNFLEILETSNIPSISSKTINDYLRSKNDHSMFLEPTDKEEIHIVVSQFSLRRLRDDRDMNMYWIRYIIASITKPLMHICNLSFNTGIFSDEMKIARVMPIFGNKINLKTTDQFPFYPYFQKFWKNYF